MTDLNTLCNSIAIKTLGELIGNEKPIAFFIPAYQRGYRWTPRQVRELLTDLTRYLIEHDGYGRNTIDGDYYCLQPLVVKKKDDENIYEVVDGQQRLTTLLLLLKYLNRDNPNKTLYTIEYETRPESKEFIDNISTGKLPFDHTSNIDFYHIYQAYKEIEKWFNKSLHEGAEKDLNMASILSRDKATYNLTIDEVLEKSFLRFVESSQAVNLKEGIHYGSINVVWYELHPQTSLEKTIEQFNNLNTGKISLTDSELIKAVFLKKRGNNDSLQKEHGLQWEEMETHFYEDGFWAFLSSKDDNRTSRLDLLFELCYKIKQEESINSSEPLNYSALNDKFNKEIKPAYSLFNYFYNKLLTDEEVLSEWNLIYQTFLTLLDWYSNAEIYNYVGLINQENIASLYELYSRYSKMRKDGMSRAEFVNTLKDLIRQNLNIEVSDDQSIPVEYGDKNKVRKLLLLLNIVQLNQQLGAGDDDRKQDTLRLSEGQQSLAKFPFAVMLKQWDIEHIDSQTANDLTNANDMVDWIRYALEDAKDKIAEYIRNEEEAGKALNQLIEEFRKTDVIFKAKQNEYLAKQDQRGAGPKAVDNGFDTAKLGRLIKEIRELCKEHTLEEKRKNNIANLTLLDAGTNRAYGNSLFATKRRFIIKRHDSGQFIPASTQTVFFKLFSSQYSDIWDEKDMEVYSQYMIKQLKDFLQ